MDLLRLHDPDLSPMISEDLIRQKLTIALIQAEELDARKPGAALAVAIIRNLCSNLGISIDDGRRE